MRKRQAGMLALALMVGAALSSCGQPTPKVDWETRDEIDRKSVV